MSWCSRSPKRVHDRVTRRRRWRIDYIKVRRAFACGQDPSRSSSAELGSLGRCSRGGFCPFAEVATRLADAFAASFEYLAGNAALELDRDVLRRVEHITRVSPDERLFILRALDAPVRNTKARKAYAT